MVYVVFALQLWLVVAAMAALRPSNRWPFSFLAFPVGFAAGELPVQAIVVDGALVAGLRWWGWPSATWQVVAVLVLGGVIVAENLALIAVQLIARRVVRRAMATAPRRPLPIGRVGQDAFGRWWRTMLQIPFAPRAMVRTNDVAYGSHPRQRLDVWRTAVTPLGAPVLFYIHGGSWTFGDKREQARPMLHEFVAQGWIVVTANYRFAPSNPWPAQIEDVTRVVGWIKRNIVKYGGDPDRLVVAGGSAGGHLAALVALAPDEQWRPSGSDLITDWSVRGCISLYGVLEMTGDESLWRGKGSGLLHLLENRVVQQRKTEVPHVFEEISPYHRIRPDAPPFLVVQGSTDSLVDVGVARSFTRRFLEVALAPLYYVELPLTQHSYDLVASPRSSATTRAAVAFATAVARPRPTLDPALAALYEAPPVLVEVADGSDAWRAATEVAAERGEFFVVTPDNPYSQRDEARDDEADHAEMRALLAQRGWTWLPARNRDSRGQWPDEHGYALFGIDAAHARGLAAYFNQHAFYVVDAKACRVVPTL